jgi:hypothetical protein
VLYAELLDVRVALLTDVLFDEDTVPMPDLDGELYLVVA